MGLVSDAVGEFLEEKLLSAILDLEDYRAVGNHPDFRWRDVWVEAKAAFDAPDYGCILKFYQLEQHHRFRPLVYAFGYHDFDHAMQRLTQKTDWGKLRHLRNNASITRLYFVSASIAESIWVGNHLISEKAGMPYCRVPPHILQRIMDNKPMKRRNQVVVPREYYSVSSCVHADADPLGYVLTERHYEALAPLLPTVDPSLFAQPI